MKTNATIFFDKITKALKDKLPFTAYRYPDANDLKGFFQKNDTLYYTKDYSECGFVFAPFDTEKSSILFPLSELEVVTTDFKNTKRKHISNELEVSFSETARKAHLDLVQKGINFLYTGEAEKVVLSRKEMIDSIPIDVIAIFRELLSHYKNALVYIWFHPEIGLWLGACPETLLKTNGNEFETMALAGTLPDKDNLDVLWPDKERQEQQYVTDFILQRLSDCKNIDVSKPETKKAGSVLHLCTTITGVLPTQNSICKLIKALHPTPAVCGVPQQKAKDFILENEGYDREFYTGFLGEINLNNTSNLYVNLRCMQVLEDEIAIYVGGGITKCSNPRKEWEETVKKSEVMKKVLDLKIS